MADCIRFSGFELNVAAYSLRRAGRAIKLERIPMEVLMLLARRPGELVLRSEIQAALWDPDVHVEHASAINTAIRKIRRALGDSADRPCIIETIVGKGYRFIAAVENAGVAMPGINRGARTTRALPAAYDAYVRGRHAWNKRTEPHLREGLRWFQLAIDADPTYAPAYAGLADCYGQLGYGSYVPPHESFPRARAAALRALHLDPALAEAHAALGFALMYYDWDFPGAEAAYTRALALNRDSEVAHQWYAYLLTAMERPLTEAEREIATARQLDPLSVAINIDHAYILHYYGRNDDALRAVRRGLEMNPEYPGGYFWLARIYTAEGRYDEAELAVGKIGPLRTWAPAMAVLGYLYARTGRTADAHAILSEFEMLTRSGRYASSYAIAVVHAGLGDAERALAALHDAYEERSHWLVWLKRDPRWSNIRSDPRFQSLVKQVGLPVQMVTNDA